MDRRARWIAAATAGVVLAVCVLAWWVLRSGSESVSAESGNDAPAATSPLPAPTVDPERGLCDAGAKKPFTPHRITIEDVIEGAEVVGVPRDSRGVTGVLSISNKVDFAWDVGGIRPGSSRGNVLLNTHTWPDGSATGNAMLDRLRKGDQIVLHGSSGARLCYEVARRVEVLTSEGYPPYYETDGPPQVAIIVCSGTRDSAGEWSHRTIWFARPVEG